MRGSSKVLGCAGGGSVSPRPVGHPRAVGSRPPPGPRVCGTVPPRVPGRRAFAPSAARRVASWAGARFAASAAPAPHACGWMGLLAFPWGGAADGQRRVRGFACRAAPVRLTQRAVDSCSPLMPADCDALRPLCCSDSSTTSNLRGKNRSKVNDGTLSFFQESGFRKLD